jgi:hypothetical protein
VNFFRLAGESCGPVLRIPGGNEFAAPNGLNRFAHHGSVHHDPVTRSEVPQGDFVFRGYVTNKSAATVLIDNLVSAPEISQGDQDVVVGIDSQYPISQQSLSHIFQLASSLHFESA